MNDKLKKWITPAVGLILSIAFWEFGFLLVLTIMFLTMMWLPLVWIKDTDKFFQQIRKKPIELIGFMMLIAYIVEVNHRWRGRWLFRWPEGIIYRISIFALLCLFGYLICYLRDLHEQGWRTLKQDSFIWRAFEIDLKKGQGLKIFVLFLIFVIIIPIGLTLMMSGIQNNTGEWTMVMLVFYLFCLYINICHRVAKISTNYAKVHDLAKNIAGGNLDIDMAEDFGLFNDLRDELTMVQNGLTHAVEKALASERMKGELITNVSHDLKTPLTSIITYIDLLQKGDITDEKRDEYIKTLELKTDRLKTLIEDLFEVSKASSGNLQLELAEVDLETLMKQTILGLEDRISETGLILREVYPEKGVKLQLDGARMHRIFENLIVNMVKYAMPNTRAYIDVADNDNAVQIIFKNISEQEISHDVTELAGRFVRGEASRTTDGSGLGLAIAKSFTELQGGKFDIAVDGDLFKVMLRFDK